jgi:hypothetical protein
MPAVPELQRLFQERTLELEAANEALRQTEQALAIELDTTERLQHVATQLVTARGTGALYEQILDTALAILHADFARGAALLRLRLEHNLSIR